MTLDFGTLYVVVLINSILMTIVWAVIYGAYDRFQAAGIWTVACLVLAGGGISLSLDGYFGSLVPIYIGNVLIVAGFSLVWIGLRRFQNRPLPWASGTLLVLIVALILPVFTFIVPNYGARSLIYSIGQSLPLAFSMIDVLRQERRLAGSRLALWGMGLGIFSHVMQTGFNLAQIAGVIGADTYAVVEPAVILLVVFNAMLWNLGLVLMVIDRLYAELSNLAMHDELTGLANRRALIARLQSEIVRAHAGTGALSLLVIDLDNFKDINDGSGHLAGDACLVHVARTLGRAIRPDDLLARTGGDEFCVLLPGADAGAAGDLAARLVAAMREAPFRWGATPLPVTLSIGAAEWRLGQTGDELNAAADLALYKVKGSGRDGYAVAPKPQRPPDRPASGPAALALG